MRRWWRREAGKPEPSDADIALEKSREQREEVRQARQEHQQWAERMRLMRKVNHLAERFGEAFGVDVTPRDGDAKEGGRS